MQKKFLSNLLLLIFLNLLIKPLAIFGIDATVQNRVGSEAYGLYFAVLNLSYLFNILLDLGINNYTTKHVARYPDIVPSYLGKLVGIKFILFALYALVTTFAGWLLGFDAFGMALLGLLIVNQFLVVFIAYLRSHLTGLMLFRSEALISVLDKLLLILFCGALLVGPFRQNIFHIEWLVYIQTACYALSFLTASVLLFKHIGVPKLRWKPVFTYAVLKQSFPYALLILLMSLYSRTDSVMIERLLPDGDTQSGFYAQGFRLLDASFMFAMLFSGLLFPIFSRMLQQKQAIGPIVRSASGILISGAIALGVISIFHASEILSLIYKDVSVASVNSFRLLMAGFTGMCTVLIYGTILTANGSLRFLNVVSVAGIAINIFSNFLLIPKYGAPGAAFTTLITQSAMALIQYFYARRIAHIRFSPVYFLRFVAFIALFTGFVWFMQFTVNTGHIALLLEFIIVPVLILLLKLVDLRRIREEMLSEV